MRNPLFEGARLMKAYQYKVVKVKELPSFLTQILYERKVIHGSSLCTR